MKAIEKSLNQGKQFYKVQSKSEPELLHEVSVINGEWDCDCYGFPKRKKIGQDCRHIKEIKVKMLIPLKPEHCWFCNKGGYLEEHHLYRGWQRKTSPTIYLCLKCHKKATEDKPFEIHLQELYAKKIK